MAQEIDGARRTGGTPNRAPCDYVGHYYLLWPIGRRGGLGGGAKWCNSSPLAVGSDGVLGASQAAAGPGLLLGLSGLSVPGGPPQLEPFCCRS